MGIFNKMSEEKKLLAAYALNLCTVSVSQIVDYDDVYILEQEYEMILNNLNLEVIPKDEALLEILKQLLNTITYFRIQEDEKRLLVEEYQHNMKNAIWNAVPNLNVIVAGGTPATILGATAAQVGIGYMNYRRAKAENAWEFQKKNRKLMQSAMEQLNALRRELFETAWRLAEKYGFPDSYRLTERQISQYNQILLDSDDLRRYERLDSIHDSFDAYPPFWFFFGHAAYTISCNKHYDAEVRNAFKEKAVTHYQKFNEVSRHNILREDQITAACALEHFTLIDNIEEKRKLLEKAEKFSGGAPDVLQHCALMRLSIGDMDDAATILRKLINEGYSVKFNAQILSRIYVTQAVEQKRIDRRVDYKILQERTSNTNDRIDNSAWLYPMPALEGVRENPTTFISQQRTALLEWYADLLSDFYTYKANECRTVLATVADIKENTEKEKVLVEFALTMMKGFELMPYSGIDANEFVQLIRQNKNQLESLAKRYDSKAFENAFGVVFVTAAKNISNASFETMEDVYALEKGLWDIEASLCNKTQEHGESAAIEDVETLLNINRVTSDRFKEIKQIIIAAKANLMKSSAKHTELLIDGSLEYKRYIHDHNLERTDIIAIINDRTILDCDLLFTESRLETHRGQSKGARYTKTAVAGIASLFTGGVGGALINSAAELAIDELLSKNRVLYTNVEVGANKIIHPNYRNDNVNFEQLVSLISEIQGVCKGSVVDQIREIINASGCSTLPVAEILEADHCVSLTEVQSK